MKRHPPFNQPDGTPWTNGNPATGQRGSILNALAVDHAQAEITNAITRLGLTPQADDLEQLGKAIQAYVSALTGAGDTALFVTLELARSRLMFYPHVQTADGRLNIISPSPGTIFVPAEHSILHRSIHAIALADIAEINRTFVTEANKVYHLRQDLLTGSLGLFDLSDAVYNPGGLSEGAVAFCSTFDNAILARIITNSSNVAMITSLANLHSLIYSGETAMTQNQPYEDNKLPSQIVGGTIVPLNWARKPRAAIGGMADVDTTISGTLTDELNLGVTALSRYSLRTWYQYSSPTTSSLASFAYEAWA